MEEQQLLREKMLSSTEYHSDKLLNFIINYLQNKNVATATSIIYRLRTYSFISQNEFTIKIV